MLPRPQELEAFIATHVLGWHEVHWHPTHDGYVGKRPHTTVETPVPRFTEHEDLVAPVQAALQRLGHRVQATPVPEGWRVQVDEAAATSRMRPLALCASVWRALRAG